MRTLLLRQSCPGGAYYVCQNGFKGCCSIDPCGPGISCPDSSSSITSVTNSAPLEMTTTSQLVSSPTQTLLLSSTASSVPSTTTSTSAETGISATTKSSPTASSPSLSTARVTLSTTTIAASVNSTSTLTGPAFTTALSCPAANGTRFTDTNGHQYSIHCNQNQLQSSFGTVLIDSGGFSQCFETCDNVTECAGFTFVGVDGGSCYLKDQMPESGYNATAGSNYVSCERLSVGAGSPHLHKTVIAGIAAGSVGAFLLLALAIAVCARRRRKSIEERRAATRKSNYAGAAEDPGDEELFAPYGGFYRDGILASREASYSPAHISNEKKYEYEATVREERQPLANAYEDGPAQLDGNPVYPNIGDSQIAEMDATHATFMYRPKRHNPDEPPVLGRLRRIPPQSETAKPSHNLLNRRHIMSWNNYDATEAVVPPSTMSSGLSSDQSSPDVSPIPPSAEWKRASRTSQIGEGFRARAGNLTNQEKVSPLIPITDDPGAAYMP